MDVDEPFLESRALRLRALRSGVLLDLSSRAREMGASTPIAIHVDAISKLAAQGDNSGVEFSESTVDTLLENAIRICGEGGDFGIIKLPLINGSLCCLYAYPRITDLGDEVMTIVAEHLSSGDPERARHRVSVRAEREAERWRFRTDSLRDLTRGHDATRVEKLPSPQELVRAFRMTYCDASATRGRRPLGNAPPLPKQPYTPDCPWPGDEGQAMARFDPVGAAKLAERYSPRIAMDYWIAAGDVTGALASALPYEGWTSSDHSYDANYRIVLSLILRLRLNAADVMSLRRVPVTEWGRAHRDEVQLQLQGHIDLASNTADDVGQRLLRVQDLQWRHTWPSLASPTSTIDPPRIFLPILGGSELGAALCASLIRDAENAARAEAGIPYVGAGWISETETFNLIKSAFGSETVVIREGSPDGLGRQRLDIWIPEWRIGVEFQGLQHDEPVAFFGGEEAWRRNVERDARKRGTCARLGITLIEVRSGYDPDALTTQIRSRKPDQ